MCRVSRIFAFPQDFLLCSVSSLIFPIASLATRSPLVPPTASVPVPPVAPVAPVGPVTPSAPVAPVAPVGPVTPVAPSAPVAPVGPVGLDFHIPFNASPFYTPPPPGAPL
ncbi:hypothetical protein BGU64_19395 [Clostridioides difficile]|nr:hypothetical protein BGU64_19395 [Clostridioides difficile]